MHTVESHNVLHRPRSLGSAGALRGGFTIIELVMVLTILGVVATFALPRINLTQYRMDSAVRLTRTTLQRAQRMAITRQHDMVVSFNVSGRAIRVIEDANNDGLLSAGERVTRVHLEEGARFEVPPVGVRGAVLAAVVGPQLRTLDGMPTVVFHRDGAASTDLEVYLSAGRSRNNDFRGITVVQSTGRTEWWRYINSRWKAGSI